MSVSLKEIYHQIQHFEIQLVAGKNGMSKEVRWTHMVDSDTVSAFLQGNELVFTTGLGLNEKLTLPMLVKDVYKNGASGIVINTGPYISEIGQEILDFAEEHDFPVFEVPWHVRMAEIMRIICFTITKDEQQSLELASALNFAFTCPKQEEIYLPALMKKGWLSDGKYRICSVKILKDGKRIDAQRLASLHSQLLLYFRHNEKGIYCSLQEEKLIIIIGEGSIEEGEEILRRIVRKFATMMRFGERFYLGAGRIIKGLRKLYISYEEAAKIESFLLNISIPGAEKTGENTWICYEKLGIYKLLFSLKEKETIEDYLRDTVLPLFEYDSMNQTDLTEVLKCYFKHDCSVKETAEELIVHRNTVNYKIHKAEEILGANLSSFEEKCRLHIGFLLYQMR